MKLLLLVIFGISFMLLLDKGGALQVNFSITGHSERYHGDDHGFMVCVCNGMHKAEPLLETSLQKLASHLSDRELCNTYTSPEICQLLKECVYCRAIREKCGRSATLGFTCIRREFEMYHIAQNKHMPKSLAKAKKSEYLSKISLAEARKGQLGYSVGSVEDPKKELGFGFDLETCPINLKSPGSITCRNGSPKNGPSCDVLCFEYKGKLAQRGTYNCHPHGQLWRPKLPFCARSGRHSKDRSRTHHGGDNRLKEMMNEVEKLMRKTEKSLEMEKLAEMKLKQFIEKLQENRGFSKKDKIPKVGYRKGKSGNVSNIMFPDTNFSLKSIEFAGNKEFTEVYVPFGKVVVPSNEELADTDVPLEQTEFASNKELTGVYVPLEKVEGNSTEELAETDVSLQQTESTGNKNASETDEQLEMVEFGNKATAIEDGQWTNLTDDEEHSKHGNVESSVYKKLLLASKSTFPPHNQGETTVFDFQPKSRITKKDLSRSF